VRHSITSSAPPSTLRKLSPPDGTGQLVETATGVHLWADRYDGTIEDIFDLQDLVTASVVGTIAPKWSVPRSSEPSVSQPRISIPMIITYVRWRACISG